MRSITVKISDDPYRDARAWAARRDTSAAAVQYLLQTLPTVRRAARAFPEAPQPLVPISPATPPTSN
jgi:hypothetical protein